MTEKAVAFLREIGMYHGIIDMSENCRQFMEEMRKGLAGEPSSLPMLPAFLRTAGNIPQNEEVIVMDAGGTNFRLATVKFTSQGAKIANFKKLPMPGSDGEITINEFFEAVADALQPIINISEKIGFCFSYHCEILPGLDGRIVSFSKEVKIAGATGAIIGEGINQVLEKRGFGRKKIVILNDTVATMMGGMVNSDGAAYSGYIGYILGTGTNTCYMEKISRILKLPQQENRHGSMAVNMESGSYSNFPQGDADFQLDARTTVPGQWRFEKMVSGYYLGGIIYFTVKKAVGNALFSPKFAEKFSLLDTFTMPQIDAFCRLPQGDNLLAGMCCSKDDTILLYDIVDAIFERAAKLTSIELGAILEFTDTGKSPIEPVCITAEGTTFYNSKLFRGKLEYYVRVFLNDTLGRYCEFKKVDDVTLIGSAVSALLQLPA